MNKKQKAIDSIEKLIKADLLDGLEDIIIFQNTDGSYELFNAYTINKTKNKEYVVTMRTTFTTHIFYSMKNAVAWCTFDKRNMLYKAKRVLALDNLLGGIEVDIALHTKIFKNTKAADDKLIYLSKLSEDKYKKRRITDELYQYINDSIRWQTKRFNRKP